MSGGRTYLDWNASAPLRPEARAAMLAALELAGNPSSVHAEGRAARRAIEDAREAVAALVGARPQEVVFTSGATEANNLVLRTASDQIVVSAVEHASVLEPARAMGRDNLVVVPCGSQGVADIAGLGLRQPFAWGSAPIVSLGLANGETGILQDIGAQAARLPAHARLHTDASQAAGRMAIDFRGLGATWLTLSSHKIGGPKGAGAVVVRDGAALADWLRGGGQERGRRAGTENVPAIAGFGAAAAAAARDLPHMSAVRQRRERLETEAARRVPGAVIVGRDVARLPNTTCLALPGRAAETLVAAFDLAGVAVSAGAACSSGKVAESHVLRAMGLAPELAKGAIRISIGTTTSDDDLAHFLDVLDTITTRAARKAA